MFELKCHQWLEAVGVSRPPIVIYKLLSMSKKCCKVCHVLHNDNTWTPTQCKVRYVGLNKYMVCCHIANICLKWPG